MKRSTRVLFILPLTFLFFVAVLCGCQFTCEHVGGIATCTHKAECSICGEEYGEVLEHSIVDGTCTICRHSVSGITYTLTETQESYSVSWDGDFAVRFLLIPASYNGKPVTEIDSFGFFDCTSLISVVTSSNLVKIGNGAFDSCSLLSYVFVSNSVEEIDSTAFDGCINMFSFEVDDDNAHYSDNSGNLYNKDETELVKYAMGKYAVSFVVPYTVTKISDRAFKDSTRIRYVAFENSATEIGSNAFENCVSLKRVDLPTMLERLNAETFANCSELKSVVLYSRLTYVETTAFANCNPALCAYCAYSLKWALPNVEDLFATVCYYSTYAPQTEGDFWYFDGDVPVKW